MVGLPAEERARLQAFEAEIKVFREYMEVSPGLGAGGLRERRWPGLPGPW
ncbi:MAG: hypothetical protein VBE63_26740 [Lamprobacter sp.]|nr:hypothetical protein [Lamprobacter sp.]MEA3643502.1 hypothetical protein [Lamprobacter sp.]